VVIGKKGADIEKLRKRSRRKMTGERSHLNIVEIRKPEIDASWSPKHRPAARAPRGVPPRHEARVQSACVWAPKASYQLLGPSRRRGNRAYGMVSRRPRAAAHAARRRRLRRRTAKTTYGTCGVKVWIFKGEILEHDPMAQDKRMAKAQAAAADAGRDRAAPPTREMRKRDHAATKSGQSSARPSRAASTASPRAARR
jgi:small subunit ribosomal protein S3